MLSIASSVLANPTAEVTLLYGNRTTGTVMFAEELADLKNRYGPRLQLVHVLSPRAAGRRAVLRPARRRPAAAAARPRWCRSAGVDQWWLCGPLDMLPTPGTVLAELGVRRDRVHLELFYVDEPPPELHRAEAEASRARPREVTVVLDGRTTTPPLPARPERSSTRAQAMRADLPFACKGGVCGTCRAKVTDGEVDMRRNYALEPRRGRRRVRAHLPELPGRRRGHRGLRRMRSATPLATPPADVGQRRRQRRSGHGAARRRPRATRWSR